jgi:phage/plasmid-like protein (TIGR03299 family)
MAHEIEATDHMFSVKEVPWHKLGTVLDDHPATSREAIEAAKLDWTVEKRRLFSQTATGNDLEMDEFFAMIRVDKTHGEIPLGVVGSRYEPLQNSDAFEFFDEIIKTKVGQYETAGSLRDGRKVWVLAKMNGEVSVGEKDTVDKYVLLSNSHDGSSAITVKITPVRVVCNNTLSAALRGSKDVKNEFSLRHTKSAKERLAAAERTLEHVNKAYEKLGKVWSKMAEIELPAHDRIKFVNRVFPNKENAKNDIRLMTKRAEILGLMESGMGMELDSAHGTLWGAYNAVTEHVTHSVSQRQGSTLDTHVDNLWFGRLDSVLEDAFSVSLDFLKNRGVDVATL